VKALDERVKVLVENQKAMANAGQALTAFRAKKLPTRTGTKQKERGYNSFNRDASQDGDPCSGAL